MYERDKQLSSEPAQPDTDDQQDLSQLKLFGSYAPEPPPNQPELFSG